MNRKYRRPPAEPAGTSGSEILRDDTRNVAERARAAGVEAVYQERDGLVHVFADYMPEGKAAFRHIAEFVRGRGLAGQ
ncbi:alpha/beta hydrolase [Actinomadura sp. 6N118]|uniref:alpha/beta hydrolase n=1 Tax=Actinomadura sp. 6N118 TaxID=3375151 RepID=UPI00378B7405